MTSRSKDRSKSIGALFLSKKTKPRSPDMTGELNILKDTMQEIINSHREQDGDVFKANMAVWFYNKNGKRYMTFELSPLYRNSGQRSEKDVTAEEFFDQIAEEQE
jgi:hypothetical protein